MWLVLSSAMRQSSDLRVRARPVLSRLWFKALSGEGGWHPISSSSIRTVSMLKRCRALRRSRVFLRPTMHSCAYLSGPFLRMRLFTYSVGHQEDRLFGAALPNSWLRNVVGLLPMLTGSQWIHRRSHPIRRCHSIFARFGIALMRRTMRPLGRREIPPALVRLS